MAACLLGIAAWIGVTVLAGARHSADVLDVLDRDRDTAQGPLAAVIGFLGLGQRALGQDLGKRVHTRAPIASLRAR
jgi:hypothetical protein